MSNTLFSTVIGPLNQEEGVDDWWTGNKTAIPFFNNLPLDLYFVDFRPADDPHFIREADEALACFLRLGESARNESSELVYQSCLQFLDEIGEYDTPLRHIGDKNQIWQHIQPSAIYVSRRHRRDKNVYVQIACNCDWEPEHGLQLVFRQGKQLTRISEQDGHLTEADAFDLLDEQDRLLSAFHDNGLA